MTVDFDAPRRAEAEDQSEAALGDLKVGRRSDTAQTAVIDAEDEADVFELPAAEVADDELSVRVIPKQANEFTCSSCYLVLHRSRLARQVGARIVCVDCA